MADAPPVSSAPSASAAGVAGSRWSERFVHWCRSRLARATEPSRIATLFCNGLTLLVLVALAAAVLAHEIQTLRTSVPGAPYPTSIYTLMATPGTSPVPGTPGAAGADFSQVYTSALALRHGESAYRPKSPEFADKFGRLPGYPPLMNWVGVPLSFLPYHQALLAHSALSLLAFLGVSLFMLWKLGLRRQLVPVLLAQASLYFLTPIGFTHIERGQFDLVVATGVVASFGCLYLPGPRVGLAAAAGLVGALKWTGVSFLGCFSVLGFLFTSRAKQWTFALVPAVMALGTAVFWRGVLEYWETIRFYELDTPPYGVTLQHFLPRLPTKLAPLAATLVVALLVLVQFPSADRSRILRRISGPFTLVLTNLAICFGTYSYEYHTVTLLGTIPVLVVWMEVERDVSPRLKVLTAGVFGAFVIVAFRLFGLTALDHVTMSALYAATALFFMGLSVYLLVAGASAGAGAVVERPPPPAPGAGRAAPGAAVGSINS